ncbi:YciI family protein [Puia sp.]|uniref:YciI family protein n=1 Tax=Puia sp. TaxID=2045100 RepID=UPI002F412DB1
MNNYIILFRERDGREGMHPEEEISRHRANWKSWFEEWSSKGRIAGGSGLTLTGRIIYENGEIVDGIYRIGREIVGGFLLLKAESLDEATAIASSCPIYEFDGYAEVREMQG